MSATGKPISERRLLCPLCWRELASSQFSVVLVNGPNICPHCGRDMTSKLRPALPAERERGMLQRVIEAGVAITTVGYVLIRGLESLSTSTVLRGSGADLPLAPFVEELDILALLGYTLLHVILILYFARLLYSLPIQATWHDLLTFHAQTLVRYAPYVMVALFVVAAIAPAEWVMSVKLVMNAPYPRLSLVVGTIAAFTAFHGIVRFGTPAALRTPAEGPGKSDVDYREGLNALLQRLGRTHGRYEDVLVYQARLLENIQKLDRYGDSESLRAERMEILDRLNSLTLETLNRTFIELSTTGDDGDERQSVNVARPELRVLAVSVAALGCLFGIVLELSLLPSLIRVLL